MAFRDRLNAAYQYFREQLGEASTVRALLQAASMFGTWAAKYPPETILGTAVVVGILCKLLLPDRIPRGKP